MTREIVKANQYANIIELHKGTIETLKLDDKVDVIISNWMGDGLLLGGKLDAVIFGRDKWLKVSFFLEFFQFSSLKIFFTRRLKILFT